jgi:hypothetical protein
MKEIILELLKNDEVKALIVSAFWLLVRSIERPRLIRKLKKEKKNEF